MKYEKKPEEIEIIKWTGDNIEQIRSLVGMPVAVGSPDDLNALYLNTWEGAKEVKLNDYVSLDDHGVVDRVLSSDLGKKFKVKNN